jgi:hypothetical protein
MRKTVEQLSLDERKTLAVDIEAFLKKATAGDDKLKATSDKLATDIEAGRRRHQADKLLQALYGTSYGHAELCAAVESVLAEPTTPLGDTERIKLKRYHDALLLVRKIAELKTLSADAEQKNIRQAPTCDGCNCCCRAVGANHKQR